MPVSDYLERIALNERQVSFNRMSRGSAIISTGTSVWNCCLSAGATAS